MHEQIEGTVVAITGASSGIGAATATHLAERGARLVLGARREDRLAEAVEAARRAGADVVGVRTDVTRREDLRNLVQTALDTYGRLDVLVSNAGVMNISPFDDLEQDAWDAMVATNLTGVLNGIGAALPVFRRQRSGQFVHVASTSAYVTRSPQGVYAATKAAVTIVSEALRQESGPDLRVTIVSPGMTHTEGIGKGLSDDEASAARQRRDEIAMPPSAIASAIGYAIAQPAGVDVSEIVVRPTVQP